MKRSSDVPYGSLEEQLLDVYLPDGEISSVFLYFHGGGLESGDKRGACRFAPYLTEQGIAVVSAEYRMYPRHAYPDFLVDAAQAAAWTEGQMRDWNCRRLYIGGSSAGGYLSMMLCFDSRWLTQAGVDPSAVSGYFHDAGQPTAHFSVLRYGGTDPRRVIVDETAPLFHIGTMETYPPMRFVVSDDDMHGRYEQTMLVLAALSHFGYAGYDHVVMHGTHCAYVGRMDETGRSVFGQMVHDFIRSTERNSF